MCGINGFNFEDKNILESMNLKIKHRGPNDDGIFISKGLSLGQVRLSILDLSPAGHQPMFYSKKLGASNHNFNSENIEKSQYSIVFNGEVYNYLEIRTELEKKGYKFTTGSDTEVILAAYDVYGEECINKFNGMWAFVIYDKKKDVLFCSRDRLGVKPFYYYFKDGVFIFSSELKGILEHKEFKLNKKENINNTAYELYFQMGYIPSPYTIFNDIFKLEGSTNLIFNLKTKELKTKKYYEIMNFKPINNKKKLIEEGREILKSAVQLRMRSDVEVGAFLSGGLDSSTVVSEMRYFSDISKLHTFSIGFKIKKYDETPYINIVKDAFKTKHHHYYFKQEDFHDLLKTYAECYDEPFGDYSGFPTIKISEISKEFATVILSGDGGDEIFGGYPMHLMGYRMDTIYKIPFAFRYLGSKIPVRKNLDSYVSAYFLKEAFKISLQSKNKFYSNVLSNDEIRTNSFKKLTGERLKYSLIKGGNRLSEAFRIYDLIFNTLQDNYLVKVDRASMRSGLEIRSPFLDYRFIEFSQKIPANLKVDLFKTKKLMREIIKGIVPEKIVKRGKMGFVPPLNEWLMKEISDKKYFEFIEKIKDINIEIYNFYKEKVLKENNQRYSVYKIRLFLFILWYERWVQKK